MADRPELPPEAAEHDFQTVRERITSWLVAEGYTVREGQARDAAWMLVVEDPAQRRFMVGQKPNRPDVIVIQGTVAIADQHGQLLDELPEAEREDFLYELRFRLLHLELDFQGVSHPLRQVMLNEHVYFDDLNRNDFFRTLKRVRHGIVAVIWSVGRKLHHPAPSSLGEEGGAEIN
jgi:hypothetical protein